MRWSALMALGLLGACGGDGGKDDVTTGTTNGGIVGCDYANDTSCPCPDTANCEPAQDYLNPVAVGFEIEGLLYEDGTFRDMPTGTGASVPPILKLTFADEAFFSAGTAEAQEGHFCEIAMSLGSAIPNDQSSPVMNNNNGAPMNWSWELTFTKDITGLTECGPMVDPDGPWGPGAVNLEGPFEGAHIGMGVGAMTDYLWDAFDGGYTAVQDAGTEKEFMGIYVAINDRDGHWGGCDWTMTRVYEVDASDVPLEDPDNPGYLKPLELDTVGTGPLPKGYMVNSAYWYQDFPLMDFSNLANAPTGTTSWLCE